MPFNGACMCNFPLTPAVCCAQLMKRLGEDSQVYSEDAVRRHMLTIVSAVGYMHSKNCAHRDLKPENVLLSDDTPDAEIKIVDLGLSRFFDSASPMRTICGTHKYLAPELIECDRGTRNGYDKAVDMWGVGLLAYIMLFGFNPFARDNQRATHNCILRCEWTFPADYNVSSRGKDFISRLLLPKAAERLTAEQAYAHSWFSTDAPPSPGSLMTGDPNRSVKEKLWEFNADRMLGNAIKSGYRRLVGSGTPDKR